MALPPQSDDDTPSAKTADSDTGDGKKSRRAPRGRIRSKPKADKSDKAPKEKRGGGDAAEVVEQAPAPARAEESASRRDRDGDSGQSSAEHDGRDQARGSAEPPAPAAPQPSETPSSGGAPSQPPPAQQQHHGGGRGDW